MPAQPVICQPIEEIRAPRKRQVPLNDNGEPVNVPAPKRKKTAPGNNTSTKAPAPKPVPKKKPATKAGLAKATPRKASVEIEDVAENDETFLSQRPRNPRNVIEAADGSDDDDEYGAQGTAAMSVDGDEEEVQAIEPAEEDDEAELG